MTRIMSSRKRPKPIVEPKTIEITLNDETVKVSKGDEISIDISEVTQPYLDQIADLQSQLEKAKNDLELTKKKTNPMTSLEMRQKLAYEKSLSRQLRKN